MSSLTWLQCLNCSTTYDRNARIYTCSACGGLLDVQHDLEVLKTSGISLDLFDQRLAGFERWERSGVWRFRELVAPEVPPQELVTRGEGNTTLYDATTELQTYTGHTALQIKHEGENPTGSFKDRGMASGVTQAKQLGAQAVICASTGNTSASMASFARLNGLLGIVAFPAGKVALGKIAQAVAYGATCVEVRGDFDDAQKLVLDAAQELPVYMLNSVNPYRLEGQKTIMFELLQQRRWQVPDWVVVPGGNLGNSSSFGKAFIELHTLGLIDRMPRIAVIQAEGASPLFQSWQNNFAERRRMKAETLATAIRIGNPTNYDKAVRAVQRTGGLVLTVTDQEIMDAKAKIDGSGIGCEPASAASVAGVKKLVERGDIKTHEHVVAMLTGHLLKDPTAVIEYHQGTLANIHPTFANKIWQIDNDLRELAAIISAPEPQPTSET
jgi:threonine synthase